MSCTRRVWYLADTARVSPEPLTSLIMTHLNVKYGHLHFLLSGAAVVVSPSSRKEDKGGSDENRRSQFFRVKISDAKTGGKQQLTGVRQSRPLFLLSQTYDGRGQKAHHDMSVPLNLDPCIFRLCKAGDTHSRGVPVWHCSTDTLGHGAERPGPPEHARGQGGEGPHEADLPVCE